MTARAIVVVPTYNERGNLPVLVDALMRQPGLRLLIMDDQSPDGTGALAESLALEHHGRIDVVHRSGRRGLGLGRVAMETLVEAARAAGFWKLVSRVFVENLASRSLLREVGFREVGIYERHARIRGVWKDVVIVERLLNEE